MAVVFERMGYGAQGLWARLPWAARRDSLLGAAAWLAFFLLPAPVSLEPSSWLTGWTLLAAVSLLGIGRQWLRHPVTVPAVATTGLLGMALALLAPSPFPAHWAAWTDLPPKAWLAGAWMVATWTAWAAGFWGLVRFGIAVWRALAS